jgi:hypothetical protein
MPGCGAQGGGTAVQVGPREVSDIARSVLESAFRRRPIMLFSGLKKTI